MLKEITKINDFPNMEEFAKRFLPSPYRFIKDYPSLVHKNHLIDKWSQAIEDKKDCLLLSEDSICTINHSEFDSRAFGKKSGNTLRTQVQVILLRKIHIIDLGENL